VAIWGQDWEAEGKSILNQLHILEQCWSTKPAPELAYQGRDILDKLAWIVAATMMVADAIKDGDKMAAEMARRWISSKALDDTSSGSSYSMDSATDREIVFGSDSTPTKDAASL